MTTTAIKRNDRPGREPERSKTAIKRGGNVPHPADNFKHFCPCLTQCKTCDCLDISSTHRLLVKPLGCHLKGLINKMDKRNDTKIDQAIIDCSMFLLIELERLDSEVRYHG